MLSTCLPVNRFVVRGRAHAVGKRERVALTFDDGPHPVHTARLLDLLQAAQLRATFFVVGKQAEAHPDLIGRVAAEGHELGNHTWSHSEPRQTSPLRFLNEVRQTDDFMKGLVGHASQVMRPPKGELNWRKLTGLWHQRKTVALWNIDPRDFRMSDQAEAIDWARHYQPQDGDIVLMHDNHPWATEIVESLCERGLFDRFETVTISELVGRKRPQSEHVRTIAKV